MNVKNVIENANMPDKTYEALMPYLEEDLEMIDPKQAEDFCFFYMTALMKMKKEKSYHEILVMETMQVIVSEDYEIVFSEEDMPKRFDMQYFELKKALISASVPQWEI